MPKQAQDSGGFLPPPIFCKILKKEKKSDSRTEHICIECEDPLYVIKWGEYFSKEKECIIGMMFTIQGPQRSTFC